MHDICLKYSLSIALILLINFNTSAQKVFKIGLNIGDTVPPLEVNQWIKGKEIKDFNKEKIYVVDFWATWCKPCMTTMPHLSELARKYYNRADFLAIHIYEKDNTTLSNIRDIVERMGSKMDFAVAVQKGDFMAKNWVDTSESRGIPTTFIIKDRKIEWIGHPRYLDSVLIKVFNKTWDRDFALIKRNNELYLNSLQFAALDVLWPKIEKYVVNIGGNTYDRVRIPPDSMLNIINDMVRNVPDLKFLPAIASLTLDALLKTDTCKAFLFAKQLMAYGDDPPYQTIIQSVEDNVQESKMPKNICELTAECYQLQINQEYAESALIPILYNKMAKMYGLSNNIKKALEAEANAEKTSLTATSKN